MERVVLTSAFGAVGYGVDKTMPYTEEDWTDTSRKDVPDYQRSKTLAENAAWEFIEKEGNGMQLAVQSIQQRMTENDSMNGMFIRNQLYRMGGIELPQFFFRKQNRNLSESLVFDNLPN